MKAVFYKRYGASEVLEYSDFAQPSPKTHQCLVKVHASSVNPIDWKLRSGKMRWVYPGRFPEVVGFDISGEVVEIGRDVTRFSVGDQVYARLDSRMGGGCAEYAVVGEEATARKPAQITHREAAAIPLAGLTALQGLRDKCGLRAGQHVLVNGASGGVGHFAVQIAKAMGASVTAVCGTANMDWVEALGPDRVIDYKQQDYKQEKASYDIIYDAVAVDSFGACKHLLTPRGVYITTLPGPAVALRAMTLRFTSRRRARWILMWSSGGDLEYLNGLIAEGKLKAVVDRAFPLAETRAAHEYSESGRAKGKIVIDVVTPEEAPA